MITILIIGMLLTAIALGVLWGGFMLLRKYPRFDKLNSREANKRMLQLTLMLYFGGVVTTIYIMS